MALASGIYYVLVQSFSPKNGPYVLSVRTDNIDPRSLPDLTSNAEDTWETDDDPKPSSLTGNLPYVPTKPDPLKVGSALGRYSDANDWDWFTFVLP
jgi:hypothetical protein